MKTDTGKNVVYTPTKIQHLYKHLNGRYYVWTYAGGKEKWKSNALSWEYGSGLASALSRPEALKEGSSTLASFLFLRMNVPVNLKYDAASNAQWTMRNGGTGDAGDVYTGLNRSGSLVETIWKTASAELVHTTYGRNRLGGVAWQRNVLAHAMSPVTAENIRQDNFYWYDGLQQNYQHQRGDLTPVGGPPYSGITNLQQTEVRAFNQTGNWLTDYTSSPALYQTRTHNKAHEIASLTGPSGVAAPAFSAVGNMTSFPKPGVWTTGYTAIWDAWNRQVTLKEGSTVITANRYDALTRRTQKTTSSETRDFYYDRQWRSIEERVGTAIKAQYVWSPFDRWTLIQRKRSAGGILDQRHYVLKDYLDPVAVMTSGGNILERFGYDAFGQVRFMDSIFVEHSTSVTNWNFLFHGEFMEVESGLYYYGFRFYDPYFGRWINRDPIGERGGYNLYAAFLNNGVSSSDVLGLCATEENEQKLEKCCKCRYNRTVRSFDKRRYDCCMLRGELVPAYEALGISREECSKGGQSYASWTYGAINGLTAANAITYGVAARGALETAIGVARGTVDAAVGEVVYKLTEKNCGNNGSISCSRNCNRESSCKLCV